MPSSGTWPVTSPDLLVAHCRTESTTGLGADPTWGASRGASGEPGEGSAVWDGGTALHRMCLSSTDACSAVSSPRNDNQSPVPLLDRRLLRCLLSTRGSFVVQDNSARGPASPRRSASSPRRRSPRGPRRTAVPEDRNRHVGRPVVRGGGARWGRGGQQCPGTGIVTSVGQ
jgi:hypothetical protein